MSVQGPRLERQCTSVGNLRNLRNLRNYTVKLADVGCTKPKVDTKQHVSI